MTAWKSPSVWSPRKPEILGREGSIGKPLPLLFPDVCLSVPPNGEGGRCHFLSLLTPVLLSQTLDLFLADFATIFYLEGGSFPASIWVPLLPIFTERKTEVLQWGGGSISPQGCVLALPFPPWEALP